jgi:CRP/FNR family transcriptional regulator, cyclic AMP receptor protein
MFLAIGAGRVLVECPKGELTLAQEASADAMFFVQSAAPADGSVHNGKAAIVSMLGGRWLLWEGMSRWLAVSDRERLGITHVALLRIEKAVMTHVLYQHPALAERPDRSIVQLKWKAMGPHVSSALCKGGTTEAGVVQKMSQETLAELGGHAAMDQLVQNTFRNLGFIEYNGGLRVRSSLLNVVLND